MVMEPTRLVKRAKNFYGWGSGELYDDRPPDADISTTVIVRIVVGYSSVIDSVKVDTNNSEGMRRGGVGGQQREFNLGTSEFIIAVEGTASGPGDNNPSITSLKFVTNKGRSEVFGTGRGQAFTCLAADGVPIEKASKMGLISFRIHAGTVVHAIEPTFAEYGLTSPSAKTARYEKISLHRKTDEIAKTAEEPTEALRNSFTRHLISPIVTICPGAGTIKFRVYEDTLCQLPFFRAALQGGFKEAQNKVIDMPDDDPSMVSALIEFLTTGNYTYAYNSETSGLQDGQAEVPVGDIDEGVFHLRVYVTASKYSCSTLAQYASNNLRQVFTEVEELDVLKMWSNIYMEGLGISDIWGTSGNVGMLKEQLVEQVGLLFTEHGEEMEKTMNQYPELSCDLLRLATTPDANKG